MLKVLALLAVIGHSVTGVAFVFSGDFVVAGEFAIAAVLWALLAQRER